MKGAPGDDRGEGEEGSQTLVFRIHPVAKVRLKQRGRRGKTTGVVFDAHNIWLCSAFIENCCFDRGCLGVSDAVAMTVGDSPL